MLIQEKIDSINKPVKYLPKDQVLWFGGEPVFVSDESDPELANLILPAQSEDVVLTMSAPIAEWFSQLLAQLAPDEEAVTYKEIDDFFKQYFGESIEELTKSDTWASLKSAGLIILR